LIDETDEKLVRMATEILGNSYAPYSGIHVASAILAEDGRIYRGVNVENVSIGLTICAERSAITAMITAGARKPLKVAIVTDYDHPIPPCGACRQVIAEFNPEAEIIMHSVKSGETLKASLSELFPSPFKLKMKREAQH
jgi:cytidine deaminase